jgi:diguanylate cyclase (GGDEF)-like protein
MAGDVAALVGNLNGLLGDLQTRGSLEETLQAIAERAAVLVATSRVSVRLLDPTRTRLMARARAGESLHAGPDVEFRLGEGLIGWIAQHGAPILAAAGDEDPRFAPRAGQKEGLGAFLGVPLLAGRSCLGVLAAVHPTRGYFTKVHQDLMTLVAGIAAPYAEVARLARLAHRDPLTGTLNRRGLEVVFPDDPGPLTIAIGDVDHFKQVNDSHGHAMGDRVLQQVALLLGAIVRNADAVVRYGGEEFVLVMAGVDEAVGLRVAERCRRAIEAASVELDGISVKVTISFGVAARQTGEPRDAVIARADGALYVAKQLGRNRVELAR